MPDKHDEKDLVISPATPDDVPALLHLIGQLAEYEKFSDMMTATPAQLHESLFGARPYGESLVARFGGQVVGYTIFFHTMSTFSGRPGIFVEDVFVSPEMRGRGIGTKLLAHVAAIARDRKCARVEWMVLNWNQSAIDLYRKLGSKGLDGWTMNRMEEPAISRLADRRTKNT